MTWVQELKNIYEQSKVGSDAVVDQWPLMSSPLPVLLIVSAYAAFVLRIGPKFMKDREPMKIEKLIIVYNAFQVIYSAYLVTLVSFLCNKLPKLRSFFFHQNRFIAKNLLFCTANAFDGN